MKRTAAIVASCTLLAAVAFSAGRDTDGSTRATLDLGERNVPAPTYRPAPREVAGGGGEGATAVAGAMQAAVATPANVRLSGVGATSVSLRWRSVPGATRYRVWRGSAVIGRPTRTAFTDRGARQLTSYSYSVQALKGSQASAKSPAVPATTRSGGACHLYAAPSGNNAGPGSSAQPFRTITKLASSLAPGEVGCVRGSHVEDVTIARGGGGGRHAVVHPAPATRARVRGRLWVKSGANFVAIQGLFIDGRNPHSGRLPSPTINASHTLLLHNEITNYRTGICVLLGSVNGYGAARNTVVDSNRIHDCGTRPANNHEHGMYLENSIGARVTNNAIWASADRGIQLYPNARNTYIARNVLDGNGQGIIFSGTDGYASSGNRVVDNVISNSRLRYNIEHWWPAGNPVGRNNVAARNCLWNGAQGNHTTPPAGYRISATKVADPKFRNRAKGDFRPGSGSGCRHLLLGGPPLRSFS
jgi:hypothetical protein